jgi:hypothetical protein
MKEFTPLRKKCEDLRTKKMNETSDTQNTIQTTQEFIKIDQFRVTILKIQSFTRVSSKISESIDVIKTQTDRDIFLLTGIKNKIDRTQVSE